MGGQSGVAVTHLHGNHQDVGSNPATARNENQTLGDPLHRRWPKGLDRISVEDWRCKAELDLEKNRTKETKKTSNPLQMHHRKYRVCQT